MSIWQTQSWQDMLVASGQSEEYFMIERDNAASFLSDERREFKGGIGNKIFVEKRRVSFGEYGLFIIGFEGELDGDTQESLQELCREENCLFLQSETINYNPPLSDHSSVPLNKGEYETQGSKGIVSGYYKKFIPPYTVLINLTQSEDDILAAMKPKGRYNIKLARKKGVIVRQIEKTSKNIKKYHELMSETTSRDNFAGNTLEYYKIFLESLGDSQLFFAYYEENIIAAGIFVVSGDVMTYYYGASSNQNRNLMAPYLLQWTAIEYAKKQGCKIYDFLGVAGDNEKKSSLSGVTDFKMKISPKKYLVSRGHIYIHKKWKYRLIMLMRKLKK